MINCNVYAEQRATVPVAESAVTVCRNKRLLVRMQSVPRTHFINKWKQNSPEQKTLPDTET
jgi:hypothetical protein